MDKVSEIPEKKWIVNDSDSSIDLDYLKIAEEACSFIEENEVIYINSGTSGNLMCRYLPNTFHYSVVTNSVHIADEGYIKLRISKRCLLILFYNSKY